MVIELNCIIDCKYGHFSLYIMKPFIILFWRHLFIFVANVSSISFLPLTPFLITVFNDNPGLPTRFLFFSIAFQLRFQDVYHIKRNKCVFCLDVGKVLIFFILKLNNNSISPTKCPQFVCITLIKTSIKNVNSQHPINYF